MTQQHESRKSDSPYIETIWRTHNLADGVYSATPDAAWDLIVAVNPDGSRFAFLAGQATKPQDIPYEKGSSSVGISFTPGAYMPIYPGDTLLDRTELLPNFDDEQFMLSLFSRKATLLFVTTANKLILLFAGPSTKKAGILPR